jgi:hypothetical protein
MISDLDRFFADLETEEILVATQPEPNSPSVGLYTIDYRAGVRVIKPDEPCWHCSGSGKCDCMTCGHFEAHATWTPGSCVPCSVRKQAKVQ